MPLTKEARHALQASIDALKKRLSLDANDLDYESHLHTIRTLQKILDRARAEETRGQKTEFQ